MTYSTVTSGADMKELDTVKLISDFENVKAGTIGVIVCEYDGTTFEVEFFDNKGDTIDVITTPSELLSLEGSYNETDS
jgi:hypothetical protein